MSNKNVNIFFYIYNKIKMLIINKIDFTFQWVLFSYSTFSLYIVKFKQEIKKI